MCNVRKNRWSSRRGGMFVVLGLLVLVASSSVFAITNYVVMTTDAIEAASTTLSAFVAHKQSLGHTVAVITSSDVDGWEAADKGTAAADKMRAWLKDNYLSMGIEYVLLIGHSNFSTGTVPMRRVYYPYKTADTGSDFFYAELSGTWDLDGDGIYGEWDDVGSGGIDFDAELKVGRIGVYSTDPEEIAELDHVFEKIIAYETAEPYSVAWRKHITLFSTWIDIGYFAAFTTNTLADLKEHENWTDFRNYNKDWKLVPPQDEVGISQEKTKQFINAQFPSVLRTTGHGASGGTANTLQTYELFQLDDQYPSMHFSSSCNLGNGQGSACFASEFLKHAGIGSICSSQSGPDNDDLGNEILHQYMKEKTDIGAAMNWMRPSIPSLYNLTLYNLWGDPSIKLFATGSGVETAPEIQLFGGNLNIHIDSGQDTPSIADGTSFGTINPGEEITKTFTIANTGTEELSITDIQVAGEGSVFSATSSLPITVASRGSETFTVQYDPGIIQAANTAVVTVVSDDADESNYTFVVKATCAVVPEEWVAYHDSDDSPDNANDHENSTHGSAHNTEYAMKSIDTGVALPAKIKYTFYKWDEDATNYFDDVGSRKTSTGVNPELDTAAYDLLNGFIDSADSIYLDRTATPETNHPSYAVMQISGLDTLKKYSIALYVHRNNYSSHHAIYTLQGVSDYTPASSAGVGGGSDSDVEDEDVDISPDNDSGYLVQWDEIILEDTSGSNITIRIDPKGDERYVFLPQAVRVKTMGLVAGIEASSLNVDVPEGGTQPFNIRLRTQPIASTTVIVSHVGGDTDIQIQGTSSFVFETNTWNQWQTVTLQAAEDSDWVDGVTTVRCSAVNVENVNIIATESDNELDPTYAIPWEETFEDLNMGDLAGQHGWTGSGTVQAGTTQVLSLQSATASHTFDGAKNEVLIEFQAKFIRGAVTPTDTGTAVAIFSIDTNGYLVAYSNTTPITISEITLTDDWHTFKAQLDYNAQTWAMTIDGALLVDDFAFYSEQRTFMKIAFKSGSQAAFLDEIYVTNQSDSDADGIPNDWEAQYYGGPTNAVATNLCANGINTILEAYIAGLNPTNPVSIFEFSNLRNVLGWDAVSGRVYTIFWTSNLLSGFQTLETNCTGSFTDTVHQTDQKGFYKIKVELAP